MKERNVRLTNLFCFALASLLVAGFQTSSLPFFLSLPARGQLWIFLPTYIGLYHPLGWGIAYAYCASVLLFPFTNMPLGVLLSIHLIVVVGAHSLKSRIFWQTMSYYLVVSGMGLFFYQFLLLPFSRVTDPQISSIVWWEVFVDLLMIPTFGSALFLLGKKLDRVFPMNTSGAEQR